MTEWLISNGQYAQIRIIIIIIAATTKDIQFPVNCLKSELWAIVASHKPTTPRYWCDEMAFAEGEVCHTTNDANVLCSQGMRWYGFQLHTANRTPLRWPGSS